MKWVLLVEDEPDHRLLIREAFLRVAPDVALHEVGDTGAAVAWVKERFAAGGLADGMVILDLGLPGPSGFRLLEWIREQTPLDGLPVVVLTASENPMDADHAFNLGAKAYFQKPADFREYLDILARAMQAATPRTDAGSRRGAS